MISFFNLTDEKKTMKRKRNLNVKDVSLADSEKSTTSGVKNDKSKRGKKSAVKKERPLKVDVVTIFLRNCSRQP